MKKKYNIPEFINLPCGHERESITLSKQQQCAEYFTLKGAKVLLGPSIKCIVCHMKFEFHNLIGVIK